MHKHVPNFKPVLKGLAMQYCTCLGLTDFVELVPWDYFVPSIFKPQVPNYGATTLPWIEKVEWKILCDK